jgi:hypothetical protein
MAAARGMYQSSGRGSGRRSASPRLVQALKQGTDTQFTEKVRDVVGLDLDQPEKAQGLCVDENIPIRGLGRTPGRLGPAADHSVLAVRRDAPLSRPHV